MQGKYWEMHAALFREPEKWDTTEDAARPAFERYASGIGLDLEAFRSCMNEERARPNVEANMAEGRLLGITGTPAFIINGKLLAGAQATELFVRVFDKELKALEAGD